MTPVKKTLRFLAAILAVSAIVPWLAGGPNCGWTKTSVPKKTLDEVTGIEGIVYEEKFVPGVDFLGSGLLGAAILAGLSISFRPISNPASNPTKIQT